MTGTGIVIGTGKGKETVIRTGGTDQGVENVGNAPDQGVKSDLIETEGGATHLKRVVIQEEENFRFTGMFPHQDSNILLLYK